jgi:uncharacterized protein
MGAMSEIAGIGLGVRTEFVDELLAGDAAIDLLEIVPHNWLGAGRLAQVDRLRERWPLIPHSIHLSIGGPDPIDHEFLAAMRAFSHRIRAEVFSDHVCYSTVAGIQTGELLPLPFSAEAIEHTVARIAEVKAALELPLVLENPTYYARMPGSELDEATFLTTLIAEGDCELLLDINNVYVNSVNHGYDPYAFIDRMPLDRVRYLHVAGHHENKRLATLVDTHAATTKPDVWTLYEYTLRKAGRLIPTILERDAEIPPLAELLGELEVARRHAQAALGTGA